MAVSNARPLAIFAGYMILAAALTTKSIAIIRGQRKSSTANHGSSGPAHRRRAIFAFSLLAAVSLATTWYHMFRFFQWSYAQWAMAHVFAGVGVTGDTAADGLRLGEWLRDTSLFKQAWASTLETGPRAWWSLQIFGFCANWSVLLAVQARKKSIPHAWVFVLLGQVVAISFAANMSFLAILCSPSSSSSARGDAKEKEAQKRRDNGYAWSSHTVILLGTLLWATAIPSAIGKPGFLTFLLGPHLLAFAPLVLNKILPSQMLGDPAWIWKAASMVWVSAAAMKGLFDEGQGLEVAMSTLYEHPAVSSVGWDVICCWVSFACWLLVKID